MRDHVGSQTFRRKKQFEHWLARTFPGKYLPLYEMVTFSTIPYHKAVKRARMQDLVVLAAAIAIGAFAVLLLLALIVAVTR